MEGIIVLVIGLYFATLLLISYLTSKRDRDNDAFFRGNRQSPWYIVAIAMIGTSISGVTFVSVPGMVQTLDMTYMQMVLGFIPGYFIVAYVLLPLYYKLNLTSIYGYLDQRFGKWSYRSGALFFVMSKLIGSAARLYLVVFILQALVFDHWNIPFYFTTVLLVGLMWIYTFRGGIKTIIWTDMLQTICMLLALILIIWQVSTQLNLDVKGIAEVVTRSEHARIFVFDDWVSKQNFFKQFLNGILIVVVMTGLDQDMMQKNLTCRTLKESQKNMVIYGFAFTPINYLFLALGILLLAFAARFSIDLPNSGDQILPLLAVEYLGFPVLIFFTIGIIAAAFSSADSALTAITTSVCVDLLKVDTLQNKSAILVRIKTHIVVCILFLFAIYIIHAVGEGSILNTIYKAASYTYGPLLGLFFWGLFTKYQVRDKYVPIVCVLSPLFCYGIEYLCSTYLNYTVGYEMLLFNGVITVVGLLIIRTKGNSLRLSQTGK